MCQPSTPLAGLQQPLKLHCRHMRPHDLPPPPSLPCSCGYCTCATPPAAGRRAYMTLGEVLAVARLGAQQGCTEALFTLGDKPELLYPEAAAELASMGHASTLEYVAAAAATVMRETGLLPHINAGESGTGGGDAGCCGADGLKSRQPKHEHHALTSGWVDRATLCKG